VLTPAKHPARFGCIYYGSTSPSMHEALEALAEQGIFVNALRVRGFPFGDELSTSSPRIARCSSSSRTATPSSRRCL
jgi:hypothetical protein